ncbi:uncharacterized protein LOC111329047 [Stylophora pistillata]|uniref:uncharacterized protein LOC111329047 n=1 Tax=Stylophora pistillata TaxID=50429 RepID=UPI000C03FC32|nr:uncharacterized protein LOC111329047 [Stylophora pistillata]
MQENKPPKKTIQRGKFSVSRSFYRRNSSHQGKTSSHASDSLRVRFVLPEENVGQEDKTTSKDLIALPTLPSICEFIMFSNNQLTTQPQKQLWPLTKLPPMYSSDTRQRGNTANNTGVTINSTNHGLTVHKKALANKGPVTCSKKDIRIDIKGKLPEDYRDPTIKETKRRIWDWLRESEHHQPAYMRRANTFRKTMESDKSDDTQRQTFHQKSTLTQRI